MNKKSLKNFLTKKHKDFVASIEDEEVRKLVEKNSIITGGALASALLKEEINDFDYYFTNKETCIAVAEYYTKKFKELNPNSYISPEVYHSGKMDPDSSEYNPNCYDPDRVVIRIQSRGVVEEDGSQSFDADPVELEEQLSVAKKEELEEQEVDSDKPPYRPIFITGNAITLSNKVQLIIRFYGDPEEVHKNYDFVHCTNYWLSKDKKVYLNQEALESLLSKHLRYVGSLYPVSSVIRTRKFIKRGWHINAGQYIKMLFQVSQLDLTDLAVLEDQLIGVDCAYFQQVITLLKAKKEADPDFEIDTLHLTKIVDRIF